MSMEIENYHALLSADDRQICHRLMDEIIRGIPEAVGKIWHGSPVWFIDGNPIVGYSKRKDCIQLLFWSGASFEENLHPVGKHQAAEGCFTDMNQIDSDDIARWLSKAKEIQWDYKNIVKRQGVLERLK